MDGTTFAFYTIMFFAGWLTFGLIGGLIAAQKDRPLAEGIGLALLFGPLGVVLESLLPCVAADRADGPRSSLEDDGPTAV